MHRPSALRILAEGLRPDAGGAEAARRREGADWTAVLALANVHLVAPAFFISLRDAGRLPDLPADVQDYLAFLHQQNGLRNRDLRRQALELAAALNSAGIEPMMLKGALALFNGHHADPAARMLSDLDLLVPVKRSAAALRVLEALGYRSVTRYPSGHHAYGDFVREGDPGAVDLHFELIDGRFILPATEVWRRARRMETGSARFFLPSPTDALLHNLLHAQIHHLGLYYRGRLELRQLHDFVALARHGADAVDWGFIASHLSQHRLDGPMQAHLLAAGTLLGFGWPLPCAPALTSRLQLGRGILQICIPQLEAATLPLANFCAAFAAWRMDGLYGRDRALLLRRLHHAWLFLRKDRRSGGGAMRRLFKTS